MNLNKFYFVRDLGLELHAKGEKMNAKELANKLNEAGFETSYYTPYSGLRGTYQLVRAVYDRLKKDGFNDEANIISSTFVKYNGTQTWENKNSVS